MEKETVDFPKKEAIALAKNVAKVLVGIFIGILIFGVSVCLTIIFYIGLTPFIIIGFLVGMIFAFFNRDKFTGIIGKTIVLTIAVLTILFIIFAIYYLLSCNICAMLVFM